MPTKERQRKNESKKSLVGNGHAIIVVIFKFCYRLHVLTREKQVGGESLQVWDLNPQSALQDLVP